MRGSDEGKVGRSGPGRWTSVGQQEGPWVVGRVRVCVRRGGPVGLVTLFSRRSHVSTDMEPAGV